MQIIENYVQNLIVNIPPIEKTENINLILDGGIFNGSYLIGALYFLKEMESKKYIKIHKISCCSISSVCILLYKLDALHLMPELYSILLKQFKEERNLNAFKLCFNRIKQFIKNENKNEIDLLKNYNGRVYITYYDIKKGKKIIKSKYKNIEDIFDSIYKSGFVPFIADGNIVYKNRFCDGVNPYIFSKEQNRKMLYLDLFSSDKIGHLLSVKNEKTNFHRILAGLLDVHLFYIKQHSTQMCSYVNRWSLYQTFHNYFIKVAIEKLIFYIVYLSYYLKQYISTEIQQHIIFKIISKIIKELYIVFIDSYCF